MRNVAAILVFTVILALTFLNGLLGAHVVLEIAKLYNLTFITSYTFLQIYGTILIVGLIKYNYEATKKKKKELTLGDAFERGFKKILTLAFFYLLNWGTAYIAYLILV